MQLRVDARLREHGLGRWEGLTREEVGEDFPEEYGEWISGRPGTGRGGEDPAAVAARALDALVDLPSAPVAVVVTHGGTAGRLLERLLGLGADHHRLLGGLENCAWSEVVVQGGRWRLLRHNIRSVAVPDAEAGALSTDGDAVL